MSIVNCGGYALIPAPRVGFQKNFQLTSDGTRVGAVYEITINGEITAQKGSPQTGTLVGGNWGGYQGLFWIGAGYPPDESIDSDGRLSALEVKQAAIRQLFAQDGQWLEWQSPNGATPLKCQPRITNITFAEKASEGEWFEYLKFTITANCDILYLNGTPEQDAPNNTELVSSASENWNIEEAEVAKTYRLAHTCSAVGKRQFDSTGAQIGNAWQNAKNFIQNRFALGFTGSTAFSPTTGQSIVQNSFTGSGNTTNFSLLNNYDYAKNETIDEWSGSYSLTESWLLALAASGTDVYDISVAKLISEPDTTTSVSIQGTIKGFFTRLGDYDGRFQGALYQWSQVHGTTLYNRVATYATGVIINTNALTSAVDYNPVEGTVHYQYQYSDRPQFGDAFDEYQITKKQDYQDYRTVLGINGKITGRIYESDTDYNNKWQRALAYWNTISPIPVLYNRIVNSNFFPEVSGLRQYPIAGNVDINQAEGTISYQYEFNNRENDNDINNDDTYETYTVSTSFSRDEGKSTYTIVGQIEGLSITDINPRAAKYSAANNYWNNVAQNLLLSRVISIVNADINNNNPVSTQVEKNPTIGTISYNYQWTNEPKPTISGALSEIITVQDFNQNRNINVFAMVPVLGRAAGPVPQNMNTTKEQARSLDIEIVMAPTGGSDYLAAYNLRPNTDAIVSALTPVGGNVFIDEDTPSWTWRNGRYARVVKWVYQT